MATAANIVIDGNFPNAGIAARVILCSASSSSCSQLEVKGTSTAGKTNVAFWRVTL